MTAAGDTWAVPSAPSISSIPAFSCVDRAHLALLDPIGLDELNDRAALQTRVDRKYVLTVDALEALLDDLDPTTRILEIGALREFGYASTYFDTPELTSYRAAAHRRRRRFKVRTRTYLDARSCWLEVKTRGSRGSTVKQRLPHAADESDRLGSGRPFVDEVLTAAAVDGVEHMEFAPVLETRYERTTLYLPETGSRVTIDTGLTWAVDDGERLQLDGSAIVETKTGSRASSVDRLLWSRGHRPARISKYATGLAALRPDLPSSPWERTLRRHFDVA